MKKILYIIVIVALLPLYSGCSREYVFDLEEISTNNNNSGNSNGNNNNNNNSSGNNNNNGPVVVLTAHTWGIVGPMSNWDDIAMTIVDGKATAIVEFEAGDTFCIRADGLWDICYGHATENKDIIIGKEFELTYNGKNMIIPSTGTYNISFRIVNNVATMRVDFNSNGIFG